MSSSKSASLSQSPGQAQEGPLDRKGEIDGLIRISKILECGLDKQAIAILMDLLDSGIDPESLADVILELKSYSQQRAT